MSCARVRNMSADPATSGLGHFWPPATLAMRSRCDGSDCGPLGGFPTDVRWLPGTPTLHCLGAVGVLPGMLPGTERPCSWCIRVGGSCSMWKNNRCGPASRDGLDWTGVGVGDGDVVLLPLAVIVQTATTAGIHTIATAS